MQRQQRQFSNGRLGPKRHITHECRDQSSLVGPETIFAAPMYQLRRWLMSEAFTSFNGVPIRFPLAQADTHVDRHDHWILWHVLHFGYQNPYARELDEWIQLKCWKLKRGKVKCPESAKTQPQGG